MHKHHASPCFTILHHASSLQLWLKYTSDIQLVPGGLFAIFARYRMYFRTERTRFVLLPRFTFLVKFPTIITHRSELDSGLSHCN